MRAELNIEARRTRRWTVPAAALLLAFIAGLVSIAVSGAWSAGFSGADEPAHFLNGWFVSLYLSDALGSDPMAFAAEFYLHYPKISIGHWPPAYYALLSPFFLVLPPTPHTAFALNLLVASLPALLAALLIARVERPAAALAAAFLCALTPVAAEGYAFFMLDQAVAAAALGATMLWLGHAERPAWWKALGFGLAAASAVLIKGNGWLLLFVPPLHLLLTGRWRILAAPAPWAAAFLAAAIVGPWYWLTAGISADGFNHRPGAAYALDALGFNLAALAANLGPGLALAGWGLASAWHGRSEVPGRWNVAAGCASLVLATLLIQSLVPVDLDARYMAPALPPLIVLALIGAAAILPRRRHFVLAAAALLIAAPGIAHLMTREPKIGLRLQEAAGAIGRHPSVWVVDGTTGAEGAFIAAMAVRDPALRSYSIRSSRLLAESDFMGSDYRLALSRPADVLAMLDRLGVEGVIVSRIGGASAFPHSALLRRALLGPGSRYRLVAALAHRGRPGVTEIYRSTVPVRMDEPAIRALGLPAKAGALVR